MACGESLVQCGINQRGGLHSGDDASVFGMHTYVKRALEHTGPRSPALDPRLFHSIVMHDTRRKQRKQDHTLLALAPYFDRLGIKRVTGQGPAAKEFAARASTIAPQALWLRVPNG